MTEREEEKKIKTERTMRLKSDETILQAPAFKRARATIPDNLNGAAPFGRSWILPALIRADGER